MTEQIRIGCKSVLIAALLLPLMGLAENAPGVTDELIKIGNTNPYSGPASSYGTIGKALSAFFDMVNNNGGVNGRSIEFISLNDGYNPAKTKEQVRKLVEREDVALMFQSLGTAPNSAVHRYLNERGVPQLFVATGAAKWSDPENFPWTMGFQPNYQVMGKIFGRYVLENHPEGRIGILYQNDDYGKDYVTGLRAALRDQADSMIAGEESYEVTDPTVDSQIINLQASGADIFYNVAIPKFAAQAIKKVHDIGWRPVHLLNDVSSSVSAVLKPAGLDISKGIISAAYIKDPTDPAWRDDSDLGAWSAWMDKYYPGGDKADILNAYAYAVGSLLIHVLEQAGDDLSRENIMRQAASIESYRVPMTLPGIEVNTAADDYNPLEQAQIQRFNGEAWETVGTALSAE